jgi:hypothetical protein
MAMALSVVATTGTGIVLTSRIVYGRASYRPPARVRSSGAADPRGYAPAMLVRLSRTACVSGSPVGSARSQRASVSRSRVVASVSRPAA